MQRHTNNSAAKNTGKNPISTRNSSAENVFRNLFGISELLHFFINGGSILIFFLEFFGKIIYIFETA